MKYINLSDENDRKIQKPKSIAYQNRKNMMTVNENKRKKICLTKTNLKPVVHGLFELRRQQQLSLVA